MGSIYDKISTRLFHVRNRIQEYHKRERTKHYGSENSDKTFYVIGYDYDTQGLFAIVKSVLSHVMYAVDKGWIPVVDLKNYKSQYRYEGQNAWELFFEQPCGYSLEDISKSKNIIKSYYGMYPYNKYDFYVDILDYPDKIKPIADAYKKYIRPSSEVLKSMLEECEMLGIDDKTLGVLCRGTDYTSRKPHNHPCQPEPQNVIEDAKTFLKQNNYSKVFVATEDQSVLDMFKRAFGDRLRYVSQSRLKLSENQQFLSEVKIELSAKLKMAQDYYTALYVLSRCPSILAGRTAGTLGAVLMSKGFINSKFYNLGYYK